MTTDARPRRRRASKRALRVGAWVAGIIAFAAPWGILAGRPTLQAAAPPPLPTDQREVVYRHVTRTVFVQGKPRPAAPRVRYVTVPGPQAAPPATTTKGS